MDFGGIMDYIRNQEKRHISKNFEEGYRSLLRESDIEPDEKYFP
jgi:hypothetical protein